MACALQMESATVQEAHTEQIIDGMFWRVSDVSDASE